MTTIDSLAPTTPDSTPDGGEVGKVQSGWRLALREFASSKLAVAGFVVLILLILFCFVGPVFYHSDQLNSNLLLTDLPPGQGNPLGTDGNGFDVLGRLMKGGQTSLEIGLFAALIATVIGTLWGAIAGLAGGIVDAAMMRVVDVLLSIPFLFVVLIVSVRFSSNVTSLSIILGVFSWLIPARLVRGEVLTLRVRDFVSAARVMGATRSRLITRHLIPNALGTVIVNITFQVADAILALSALGFLGFGVQYPGTDWGDQLYDGAGNLNNGYWWLIYPVGILLILTVMACNLIGDALRDALDVRLRRR
ncbi:MAG TPA: ABC transporter permease [Pseudonocardiaceae bacterium]|jgi:peptide/nickel transport system permease protein|nr:ABC transporter permease [Pseudonocardiaceae bacterium]